MDRGRIDISKIIERDRETFKGVYLKNFNLLYNLCFEYTQDSSIAEEIVQDTFTKLWEIRESISSDTNLINFLYTIAKNKCLNYLRDQQTVFRAQNSLKYLEMQFNYEALHEVADQWIQFNELKEMIDLAIEKLPEEIKKTFILSRFEELKYKEIAKQLDVSVKTVESRISKGLTFLRKELKDYIGIIILITRILN